MAGISDLNEVLKDIGFHIHENPYVYVILSYAEFFNSKHTFVQENKDTIFALIWEDEGVSIIMEKEEADKWELKYDFVWRIITIITHTSLNLVGLLAKATSILAENGIPVNVISAFYHDHFLIAPNDVERAENLLKSLGN